MDPPRAKPKRLNKALLSDIASIATEKQLKSAYRANNVAALYVSTSTFSQKKPYEYLSFGGVLIK